MNRTKSLTIGALVLAITSGLSSSDDTPPRRWYIGGIAPIATPTPVPPRCALVKDEWKCDAGLRVVKIGEYRGWQCVALEIAKGESWEPSGKPECLEPSKDQK